MKSSLTRRTFATVLAMVKPWGERLQESNGDESIHTHRPTVDGMEEVRFSLLRPACLGCYRIFGRSMHRTLMLEVVGSGGHPGAGGSHCSIPHLKPDKQLLINSRPSTGRHSLKTRE